MIRLFHKLQSGEDSAYDGDRYDSRLQRLRQNFLQSCQRLPISHKHNHCLFTDGCVIDLLPTEDDRIVVVGCELQE